MKIQTQRMNLLATILNSLSVDREALAQLGTAPKFKTDPFLDDSALYAKVDIGAFVTDGLYKKALRDRETIKATIAELDKQAEFLSSHEAGKERELAEQARLKRVEMLKLGNKALDIALPKITEWIDNYLDDAAEGKEPPTPLMELRRDVNSLKDALDDEQTVSFESRKRILQEANKLGKVSLQPFASKMGAAKVEKLKAAANALVKTSIMLMEPPKSQDETKEFDEFRNSIGTLLDIAGELGPQVKGASLLYDATRKYEEIAKINGTLASLKRIKGQNLDAQGRIAERRLQAQRDLESVERTIAMYEASRGNGGGPK